MNYFKNKIVWITGASSGIGEALAIELNKQEAIVILSARNIDELNRVRNTFINLNTQSLILPLDICDINSFEEKTKILIQHFGKIDILINNAGISQRSLAVETSYLDEKHILDTNLYGPMALTKIILPYFIKQNYGHLVNISSVMGKIHTKYRSAYAASKHGMIGYFDCLRLELDNIVKITNIMPGFVNTNIVKNAISKSFNQNNLNLKGMQPNVFAKQALKAISSHRKEVYIGGFNERFAILLKQYIPSLFDIVIKNKQVT